MSLNKISEIGGPRNRLGHSFTKLLRKEAENCIVPLYAFARMALPMASEVLNAQKGCVVGSKDCSLQDPCPCCILHTHIPPRHRQIFLCKIQLSVLQLGRCFCIPLAIDFAEHDFGGHFFETLYDHPSSWFRSLIDRACHAYILAEPSQLRLREWTPSFLHVGPRKLPAKEYNQGLIVQKQAQTLQDHDFGTTADLHSRSLAGPRFLFEKILPQFLTGCRQIFALAKINMSAETRELFSKLGTDQDLSVPQGKKDLWLAANRLRLIISSLHYCFSNCLPWLATSGDFAKGHSFDIQGQSIKSPAEILRLISPIIADLMVDENLVKLLLMSENADNLRSSLTALTIPALAGFFSSFFVPLTPYTFDHELFGTASRENMVRAHRLILDSIDIFLANASWRLRAVGVVLLKTYTYMHVTYVWETREKAKPEEFDLKMESRKRFFEMFLDETNDVRDIALRGCSDLTQNGYYQDLDEVAQDLLKMSKGEEPRLPELLGIKKEKRSQCSMYGMCSLVLGNPYTVPSHIPQLISTLVQNYTGESCTWREIVRLTLASFKRTHQDNWETHATKFTATQLDDLQSAVLSPSNYV
ncbi:Proteasome activator complex subunit 4 [Cichlidogyrus casuarinus]|uniref:Proteasome activator complex subunit 4 n=1 Tax=Cichlidogyrus casuarinus TaxID=1844966 RepID=A0ABD2Q949_9PLAT